MSQISQLPPPNQQFPAASMMDDSFSDLDESYRPPPMLRDQTSPITDSFESPLAAGPSTSAGPTTETRAERNRRLAMERLEAKRRASGISQTPGINVTPGNSVMRLTTVQHWRCS
ncbi:unnamed protein product [Echinostoma caproni]|uniref:TIMELESS-interacting protein n=1 Tax=Echinostoma caproni TaxID=27848 RepID=A0A183B760_9TREM|nr:unnamed protein product [Echinostoma caproni]